MIRDRDRIYGSVVTRRLRAMGIRDKPIAPASPWQNGFAARLIGSIRRECLDHAIICGETHLRRVLKSYADYYNRFRTHRSLNKDAPVSRSVQRTGVIRSRAIGRLELKYCKAAELRRRTLSSTNNFNKMWAGSHSRIVKRDRCSCSQQKK
jgi:Integrase core domain